MLPNNADLLRSDAWNMQHQSGARFSCMLYDSTVAQIDGAAWDTSVLVVNGAEGRRHSPGSGGHEAVMVRYPLASSYLWSDQVD